jgi:hypothetical protein
MLPLADDGPVVVLFASRSLDRAYNIALANGAVVRIRLPSFSYAEAESNFTKLQREICEGPPPLLHQRNKAMMELLRWLWRVVVSPTLEALGVTENGGETKTKPWIHWIHWIGLGIMSFAPIHAAGDGADNTMARCISSYATSLQALHHARSRARPPCFHRVVDAEMVGIAMPVSPGGYAPLEEARNELFMAHIVRDVFMASRSASSSEEARNAASAAGRRLVTEKQAKMIGCFARDATKARVLRSLSTHNIVHFACHGVTDSNDPTNSRLIPRGRRPHSGRDRHGIGHQRRPGLSQRVLDGAVRDTGRADGEPAHRRQLPTGRVPERGRHPVGGVGLGKPAGVGTLLCRAVWGAAKGSRGT